jgi:TBC1 domain family protein 5
MVNEQRSLYEHLCDKHYRQSSALSIINDMESNSYTESPVKLPQKKQPLQSTTTTSSGTSSVSKDNARKSLKIVGDDPLSIIATIEEERVKIDTMNLMEQKKNLAMASRLHKKQISSSTPLNDRTESKTQPVGQIQESLKGSRTRWDEFYSSKEVMDIIRKDLDRLPLNHHHLFHQLKEKMISSSNNCNLVMDDISLTKSREERALVLSEILFVYAREHSIGYRQGMHEILSFVMMAVEQDLITRDLIERFDVTGDYLLNNTKIIHDTYAIFDAIMASLSLAFGHYEEKLNTAKPPERTGNATVRIIREWHGDDLLADFLMGLDVPPELYCARWIRLMFSREVSSLDNVFTLWDTFFHELDSSNMTLINILETAAASMIILIKDQLLPPQVQYMYHDGFGSYTNGSDLHEEHEPMELLMNYPQMKDICNMLHTYSTLIMNQKQGIKPMKIQRPYFEQQMGTYHRTLGAVDPELPRYNVDSMFYSQEPHLGDPLNQPILNDGDQIIATLKNFQNNPALKKLSTSLNAVKGAAKDALLSLDRQIKSQEPFKSPASPLHSSSKPVADHISDPSFPIYRDLSQVQTIFEDTSHSLKYDTKTIGTDLNAEGDFVNKIPSYTEPPTIDKNVTGATRLPLSLEISAKINRCVNKLSKSLEAANVPSFASRDIIDAMTELDSIRLDIETKYDVFLK